MTFKRAELVVKSNRLIEASYRLGLNEQRIILYSICRCREEQKGLFPDLPVTITLTPSPSSSPALAGATSTSSSRTLWTHCTTAV